MAEYPKELIEKTIAVWQPKSPTLLTEKDACEITRNMTGLFDLLNELDEKYNGKKEKKI
jgi:hypothetical protein